MLPAIPRRRPPAALLLVALLAALAVAPQARAARPYRGGVVATAHPAASEAALEMLNEGGNAADAAVAAAFTLAVVGPYHSGVGGGGFALVHDVKKGQLRALDFRERAPLAATRDMYVKDGKVVPGLSTDGALSVATPGAVAGYLALHKAHGRLPRATVLAPAIRWARQGFWVSPKYRQLAEARLACLAQDEDARRIFLVKDAAGAWAVPPVGHLVRQPELARTLERIAREGERAFYTGPIAKAVVDTVKQRGGVLAQEDLARYRVKERTPLEGHYRGHRLVTFPPPSAGGLAVLQVLGALEARVSAPRFHDPEQVHLFAEAVRRSYVDRARYLGDPDFTQVPLERLTSKDYLQEMARSIDPARATSSTSLLPQAPEAAGQSTLPEKKNTTHLSVLDKDGNAVALTTTVNYMFGSCVVARGTGVLLNDEMDDFAAQPGVPNAYGLVTGEPNAVAPGKTPLSSMSPTFLFAPGDDRKVMLVVGSPGGSTIPTTVMQVIQNVVDHGMDLTRAVGAGRVHHQYLPDELWVDRWGLEPATLQALEQKGHRLKRQEAWGDAEAVLRDPKTGLGYAASDPRNEGAGTGQP